MPKSDMVIEIDKKQVDDLEKQLKRIEQLLEKIFNLLNRSPLLKRLFGIKDQSIDVEDKNG